jgi:hypothetical protein
MTASGVSRRAEASVVGAIILLVTLALLLPTFVQDPNYHLFADQRTWLGVPRAADVLSNLAFIAVGLFGAVTLLSPRRLPLHTATATSLWCIAAGFGLTGIGSAWYHLQPNDATLVWDRLPMTLVLSGVISAAIAERVGDNVAIVALAVLIVAGVFSVTYWRSSGNLTPYAVLQFGGIAALLALLVLTRAGHDPFAWGWIVGWYCFAKVAELADQNVWQATSGILAGHTIKHLAAAAAGATMFYPLRR